MQYDPLQAKLGYQFRDPKLLQLALTHPSVAHDIQAPAQTNQRLEFLGDAVLQLVLTGELYARFPEYEEGPLTKARAKLVNRRTLAERAQELNLGQHLILSRGEDLHGGRDRPSALADTFEAVLGAMFLDSDFETVRSFILREFKDDFGALSALPSIENPKGELQEFLQAFSSSPPRYQVVSTSGPDHDRVFVCTVHHSGAELARGVGKSKKSAESEAANAALSRLKEDKQLCRQIEQSEKSRHD